MELTEVGAASLKVRIAAALGSLAVLREVDQSFFEETLRRLKKYGSKTRISPKQWDWLQRILSDADVSAEAAETPNRFPYEDIGGTNHYHRRGWAVNRPKRR